ncbi:MAG: flagellar hook-length control protein FliK, partial [Sphingomonadales bacterium]
QAEGQQRRASRAELASGLPATGAAQATAGMQRQTASGPNTNMQGSVTSNTGNQTPTGSGMPDGSADGPAPTGERSASQFLARLENALETRGIQLASLLGAGLGAGEPQPDGPPLDATARVEAGLVREGGSLLNPLSTAGASVATATQGPASGGWTPAAAQVAMQITRLAREGQQEFTIRLDPPDLGRVNVKLDIAHDGKVNAVIALEDERALQLLQRDQSALERALNDAGLKTDGGSLNFSLGKRHDDAERENASTDKDSNGARNRAASIDDSAGTTSINATLNLSDRALDIRV